VDLLEYQGKQLFAKHGVPVPDGRYADSVPTAVEAAEELGYPCVVKAQVRIGKRGKAGGIKIANDRDEMLKHAEAILGMDIRGFTVHEVWIERASRIDAEYYARSSSTARRRSCSRCSPAWVVWTWRRWRRPIRPP
jgi:succinyl-CoA synthetase beta subunit